MPQRRTAPAPPQHAIRFTSTGPPSQVLKLSTLPVPELPPFHSLIRVRASAINPSDVANVEGKFPQTTLPRTPGRDFAGTVVKGKAEFLGRNVWGTGGTHGFERNGTHAEYIVVPSGCLLEMPSNLSFAQSAACGVAFLTAARMVAKTQVQKDEVVLVLGSSGAVGSAAVQLIRQIGAIPIETSRSEHPTAINLSEDLKRQIDEKTDGKEVNVVFDTVGEATLFKKAIDALGDNGRYIIITAGKTPGSHLIFDALDFYRHNKTLLGLNTLGISLKSAISELAALKFGFEAGVFFPPALIEQVDILDEKAVIAAYEKVKAGTKAKQVLVLPPPGK